MNTTEMTAGETVKRNSGNSKLKNMEAIFNPRSVAVVGASHDPGKPGFHVLRSLTDGEFGGRVFPINPKGGKIIGLGNRCNIDFADALGYLMRDPDTEIIAMYIFWGHPIILLTS